MSALAPSRHARPSVDSIFFINEVDFSLLPSTLFAPVLVEYACARGVSGRLAAVDAADLVQAYVGDTEAQEVYEKLVELFGGKRVYRTRVKIDEEKISVQFLTETVPVSAAFHL